MIRSRNPRPPSDEKKEPIRPQYLKDLLKLKGYRFVVMPLNGKVPILRRWNKLTHTPEQDYIFKDRNFGVVTGSISRITVLDIDVKDNGIKVWKNLSSSYPAIETPTVKTPSGGLHLYFEYTSTIPSFSRFELRGKKIGWDLLNNDRQVVAPPSVVNDKKYKWIVSPEKVPFAPMPEWLETYLLTMKSVK